MQKEAKARILINALLRRSGWRFFDDATGPANVSLEVHVKLTIRSLCNATIPLPPLDIQQQIVAELEVEQKLVEANRELITRMEAKIKAKLAEIWGEKTAAL